MTDTLELVLHQWILIVIGICIVLLVVLTAIITCVNWIWNGLRLKCHAHRESYYVEPIPVDENMKMLMRESMRARDDRLRSEENMEPRIETFTDGAAASTSFTDDRVCHKSNSIHYKKVNKTRKSGGKYVGYDESGTSVVTSSKNSGQEQCRAKELSVGKGKAVSGRLKTPARKGMFSVHYDEVALDEDSDRESDDLYDDVPITMIESKL